MFSISLEVDYLFNHIFWTYEISLPWGHIGYWTCKIGTATPQSIEDLLPGWGPCLLRYLEVDIM